MNYPKYLKSFLSAIVVLLLVVLTATKGNSLQNNQDFFNVGEITVQGFDRSTNQLFSLPELPNPYGLDMDLLVSIQVSKGSDTLLDQLVPPQNITLSVDAKGYTTAATGNVPPWQDRQTRTVFVTPESGNSYLPFIVEYKCYPDVIFTASLGTSNRSKQLSLPCAE